MSLTSGGTAPNGFKRGWELGLLSGLGGDRDHLLRRPLLAIPVPQPHRGGQIGDADHDPDETPGLAGIVSRPQLEHHLMLVAQVDALEQLAFGEAPEVEVVAEPPPQEVLGVRARSRSSTGSPTPT